MKNSIAYNLTSILIFTLDSNCMTNIEYWGLTKSCFRALWRIYSCLARCVMWVYFSSLGDSDCCFEESNCWRCQLENAQWELQVKFYISGKMRRRQGDSISDSSEKLLQRGSGEAQYICDFGTCTQASIFCRRFLLVTRSSCHHEGF